MNALVLLERTDKWYLGAGGPLVWAPRFPRWLDVPGFWDPAHYYSLPVGPLFTVSLIGPDDRAVPWKAVERRWLPGVLTVLYRMADGSAVRERRVVTPEGVASSVFTFREAPRRDMRLVVWTSQERTLTKPRATCELMASAPGGIWWRTSNGDTDGAHCFLTTRPSGAWTNVMAAEPAPTAPIWSTSPFQHCPCTDAQDGLVLSDRVVLHGALGIELTDPSIQPVTVLAAVAADKDACTRIAQSVQDPEAAARAQWERFFGDVPSFQCTDAFLERYYWYRWYGLNLLSQPGGMGCLNYPSAVEGPAQFRLPISYSAPCHIRELRWKRDPSLAMGTLLNFVENQGEQGDYPGHLRTTGGEEATFYHADWGGALMDLFATHEDRSILSRSYASLSRYDDYLRAVRDREGSGLTDVVNHFETGQEYSSRYLAVDAEADAVDWGDRFRLKGVDATVYAYRVKRALEAMSDDLRLSEAAEHARHADLVGRAVMSRMWDPAAGIFSDVDPRTGTRTGVKAAVCFYPYMTDLVARAQLRGLRKHLFDPQEFWTPWPVASLSRDDPMFDGDGLWRGVRRNCPWNGRVWPMTNSHIVEALGCSALRQDPALADSCGTLLQRFVRMMFHNGELVRPNCYEHYHPVSGTPSAYRGIDDYQHSWVVDLIMKYVVGLRPQYDGTIVVAPVPIEVSSLSLEGAMIRGREVRVRCEDGAALHVAVDGHEVCAVNRGDSARIVFERGRPAVTEL